MLIRIQDSASQLSYLGSLVGKSIAWKADGCGGSLFSLKNDCFGQVLLCCCCLAFLSISWSDCSCI